MTSALPSVTASVVSGLDELVAAHDSSSYREFLRVPALSLGLFAVGPGHTDSQEPHEQDEVYVVAAGQATLVIDGAGTTVSAGSIAYVPAGTPHRFVDVSGDLRVYVMFAPPEPT
jgi:mannose-6-phosphate isomerase-like protein (cupin superfamily)